MGIKDSIKQFEAYVGCFAGQIASDQKNIDLKKDHSLRVLDNAREIIASLGLPREQSRQVELAALFHDIGRFPQFAVYKTFQDQQSVNHGLLGYRELKDKELLNGLPWKVKKRILQCVLMHNRASVVNGLPRELDDMLRIVRDADKLDVVAVLIDHFDPGAGQNGVVTLGLDDEPGRISLPALRQVRSRLMVRYEQMSYINDFKLLLLSWVYDLNFAWTRREFLRREYVRLLVGSLPQSRTINDVEQQLVRHLHS